MDIAQYVNSKDIRNNLCRIKYKFNSLEAAWLISRCRTLTIVEKHNAWRELIDTMPDCEVDSIHYAKPYKSLHKMLERYMDLQDRWIEELFYAKEGEYYHFFLGYEQGYGYEMDFFSDYNECVENLKKEIDKEDDKEGIFKILKTRLREGEIVIGQYNSEGKLIDVTPRKELRREEEEIYRMFENVYLSFPVPFKKGDILKRLSSHWDSLTDGVIVMENVISDSGLPHESKGTDITDMNLWGYSVCDNGRIIHEVTYTYMDYEYCPGSKLTGKRRILNALSHYLKGEIDLAFFLDTYHGILMQEAVRNISYGYSKDSLKWVVFNDNDKEQYGL